MFKAMSAVVSLALCGFCSASELCRLVPKSGAEEKRQNETREKAQIEYPLQEDKTAKKCIGKIIDLPDPSNKAHAEVAVELLNKAEEIYKKETAEGKGAVIVSLKAAAVMTVVAKTKLFLDTDKLPEPKYQVVWNGTKWEVKELKKEKK